MYDLPTVIEGPAAAVSLADARATRLFDDSDQDAYVTMLLKVAQQQIEGPTGTLGRTIGLTKYRLNVPVRCAIDSGRLLLPPFIDITSDTTSGNVRTIEYRAGYGDPGPALPEPIKYAIVLMAAQLAETMPDEAGDIRRKIVEGVGTFEYAATVDATSAMSAAAARLLAPFKVYRV